MSDAVNAPEPTPPAPPGPPLGPVLAPHRGLAGWAWGLIVAGTAVVALMIGGGTGFGAGLIASHLGGLRTAIVRPGGIEQRLPGGIDHGGMNGGAGHGFGGRTPASPASPAPTP